MLASYEDRREILRTSRFRDSVCQSAGSSPTKGYTYKLKRTDTTLDLCDCQQRGREVQENLTYLSQEAKRAEEQEEERRVATII